MQLNHPQLEKVGYIALLSIRNTLSQKFEQLVYNKAWLKIFH